MTVGMFRRLLGRNSEKGDPGKREVPQAHATASELGINEWQLRREQLQLGAK